MHINVHHQTIKVESSRKLNLKQHYYSHQNNLSGSIMYDQVSHDSRLNTQHSTKRERADIFISTYSYFPLFQRENFRDSRVEVLAQRPSSRIDQFWEVASNSRLWDSMAKTFDPLRVRTIGKYLRSGEVFPSFISALAVSGEPSGSSPRLTQ